MSNPSSISAKLNRLQVMQQFVESLDADDFDLLLRVVDCRRRMGAGCQPSYEEVIGVWASLIAGIKAYRNRIGTDKAGLADSKAILEQASFAIAPVLALPSTEPTTANDHHTVKWPPESPFPVPTFVLSLMEVQYAQSGKTIEAIKAFRNRTGCGLKEAKELVQCWQYEHGHLASKPDFYPGPIATAPYVGFLSTYP